MTRNKRHALLSAVVVVAVAAPAASSIAAEPKGAGPLGRSEPKPSLAGAEVVELRTAGSRTYRTSRGTLVTRVTAGSQPAASGAAALFAATRRGASRDCYIVSGAGANTSHCTEAVLKVGSDRAAEHRALVRFDLSVVPQLSQIVDATLGLATARCMTFPTIPLVVQRLTTEWGQYQGATWNFADTVLSSRWTTPGGDFDREVVARSVTTASACTETRFFPARIAQAWAEGAASVGVIVREPGVSGRDVLQFGSSRATDPAKRPFLDVEYRPRTGDIASYTFERRDLTDRTSLAVNVANGNLVVNERDVEFFDTDVDYPIDRTYNNLAHQLEPLGTTRVGAGWSQGFDRRVSTPTSLDTGRTTVNGPTGELLAYTYDVADNTFLPVGGIKPQLLLDSGSFRLADPDTQTSVEFNPSTYSLQSRIDARDNVVAYDKTARAPVTAIRDPLGRRTTFSIGSGNVLRSMTDPDGGIHTHGYDPAGYLTSYTHPVAGTTRYAYADADKNLTSITTPDGVETRMTYDVQQRVRTITRITNPVAGTGQTTRYDYQPDVTISTDPGGVQRTYWYDAAGLVTRSSDGANAPDVALPAGGLWDLRGRTLPAGDHELTVTATDATGGIRAIYVDTPPINADVVFSGGGCERDCPTTVTNSWTLETIGSDAGQVPIVVTVVDGTGATSTRSFTVTMPTPPPNPPGENPNDPDPPASEEAPITTAECEQEHGIDSSFCFDPNPQDDPTRPDGGEGFGVLSARTLRWGIAQHGPSLFPTAPGFVNLGLRDRPVRYLKLNVPYNLMERVAPYGSPRDNRFKYPEKIREFEVFYAAAIAAIDRDSNGDGHTCRGRYPGDHCMELMVSFEARLRREDPDRDGREEPFEGRYLTDDDTRTAENKNYLPFKRAYIDPIQAFKRKFQRTKVISAWNEPNHRTQPTRYKNPDASDGEGGPGRAAYYTVLVSKYVCREAVVRCWVAAGDFSQNNVSFRYFNDYRRALRERLERNPGVPRPGIWAFHPYTDVANGDVSRASRPRPLTGQIADLLPANARLWLSEVGSRIDTGNNDGFRSNTAISQEVEVRYLVDNLAISRRKIDRVYYYSLCAPEARSRLTDFDSGLLGDSPTTLDPGPVLPPPPGSCASQPVRSAYGVYQRKTGGPPRP